MAFKPAVLALKLGVLAFKLARLGRSPARQIVGLVKHAYRSDELTVQDFDTLCTALHCTEIAKMQLTTFMR